MLDEAHERTLATDVLMGLLKVFFFGPDCLMCFLIYLFIYLFTRCLFAAGRGSLAWRHPIQASSHNHTTQPDPTPSLPGCLLTPTPLCLATHPRYPPLPLLPLQEVLVNRPDMKMVVMSATLDAEKFQKYFNDAPLLVRWLN